MRIREIVDGRMAVEQIPSENGLVVVDSVLLTEAVKPLAKWQRSSGFDEPLLNAVVVSALGSKAVRLVAYDMTTRLVVDVPADHVNLKRPVAVDISSLVGLLALSAAGVALAFDDKAAAISIPGGWAYLPIYDIDVQPFFDKIIEPGFSTKECRRTLADALWSTLSSLKKLASSAPAGELRLLFGKEDKVYACDGNVVAASSCYFLPTAVTVSDVEVMCAILAACDPTESVVLLEGEQGRYAVVTERASFEFQKKGVNLSKKVVEKADGRAEKYFLVNSNMLVKAVRAISSVKDADGKVTLTVKKGKNGWWLEASFKDSDGNVTRMEVSEEGSGFDEEVSVETDSEYLRSVLELTTTEALTKLEVSEKGISAESDTVYALVISGNVK